MNGVIVTAASGLAASGAWLQNLASDIVSLTTPGSKTSSASSPPTGAGVPATISRPLIGPVPPDDLASAEVDQSMALASYHASAALFKTAEEMDRTTLDILA